MAPKQRAERRTSWGLSMGAKSRNGSAQSSTQLDRSSAASPTPGPQFHRPSLSDVPENSGVPAGQGRPSRDSLRQIPSGGRTMLLADDRGGGGREDPYRGTPWQASSTVRASLDQHRGPSDRTRPSMDSGRTGAPAPSDLYSHMSPVAEDSGVGMPLHADAPDGPKRSTSFVGLPPIRRNSSLNFMGDALDLPGLSFLADPGEDDDDSDDGQNGRDPKPAADAERPASPRGPVAVEPKKEPGPPSLDEAPALPKPAVVQVSPALVQTPLLSRLPAGPWKLEESHLTEPLNQVSRNRSGTGGSMGPVVYGYDKETGLPLTRSPDLSQSPQPAPSTDAKPNFPPSTGQGYSDRSLHKAKQGSVDSRMTGDLRGDEVSETSVTTDGQSRRKKRTSFLRGFRGRDNASLASPSQESFHRRQGSLASEAESHSDRKRSLLSNAVNGGSSHSRLMAQVTQAPGPSSRTEQERRLSGLPLNESSVQAGGVDQGTRQVFGDRRDMTDLAPPQLPVAQGRRNRSGSGSGVIAGLLNHIPGSRNRDANRPSNIEIKHPIATTESKLSTETGRRGSQLSPALQGYGNERASPREAMQAQKAVATEVRIVKSPTPSGAAPPVPPPPPPSQRLLPDGNDPMYDQLYGPPKPPAAVAQRPIGHGLAGDRGPNPHPEQSVGSTQSSPPMANLASQGRLPYQSKQGNQGVAPNQDVQAQPTGRSGGLLKGLKRVTDQMSQATQRNEQSKGDKPAGRVLNAFRRGPKQADKAQASEPTQNIPQWRPSQPDLQPGQARPPQLRAAQQPPPPAQSVPLSQKHPGTVYGPPGPAPVGPTPPAPSHYNRMPPGQQARQGQVPMPPGFTAVRSEGEFVPTNYGTGRGMQQAQRQSPQQQAQRQSLQQQASAAQQRQSSLQQRVPGAQGAITQQWASDGSPPDRGINSGRAVQGAFATPPVGGGMQRPEGARASSSYYGSPPMATPDSTRGARGANNADAYRQLTVSPDLPAQTRSSIANGPAPNLGIDVGSKAQQDTEVSLHDIRPTLGASSAGTSNSDVSRTTVGDSGPRVKESMDDGPRAELEDTEEARKRTQRLEAQEEKIFCDPEDDPNHMPQMSATSYPGQEWNPYGMAEYAAEWRDD
ncbi:hypothetical protein S40293_07514 [Stachybotrys chartarum IBT 40293]|nr:hypothetical protein S40293_07514 [Stachybotrys chartarum IBT 40293]